MDAVARRRSCGWWFASLAAVALCAVPPVRAGDDDAAQYRRWRTSNTYSCARTAPDVIAVSLPEQPLEFNNLPPTAQFSSASIKNGITIAYPRFPVERVSGEMVYGSFADHFDAYPLSFDFRLDTIIDGAVVYRSTYSMACDGDTVAPIPVLAEQIDFGPPADRWRRWTWPKGYSCTSTEDGVELTISNRNVEFSGLPAHATFFRTTVRNGVEEREGPFPVEQTSGELQEAALVEVFPGYPVHFEMRIETVITGIVAYTSTLVASCDASVEGAGLTADITSNGNFDLFHSDFEAVPGEE